MIQFLSSSSLKKATLSSFFFKAKSSHCNLRLVSSLSISEETCYKLLYHCNSKSLKQGIYLHCPIIKSNLYTNLHIINNLLSLYSKCVDTYHAHNLFNEMPLKDVVSWTCMVSAHVRSGNNEVALELFQQMLMSGLIPNQFTYASILRSAASVGEYDLGTSTHARIVKQGFESNVVLGSALLDFYSKCDEFEVALQVFSCMEYKDVVSSTSMISALVDAGYWDGALKLYTSMIESGVSPNEFTFVKVLLACGFLGSHCGESVHAQIIQRGIELNLVLKTALVDMYCKCMKMSDALKILHHTPDYDVIVFTAMISGYAQVGDYKEAIAAFNAMEKADNLPNSVTFSTLLNACVSGSLLELGMQIHSRVYKAGLDHDSSVGGTLVDIYAKLSPSLNDSIYAFRALSSHDIVSCTALIAALTRHERYREAFEAFAEMQALGVEPDSYTLSTLLKGCNTLHHAMRIHAYVLKTNVNACDAQLVIGNSLVDAYARIRRVDDAWRVANTLLPQKDTYTYTSLAKGLNQMGLHGKALDLTTTMMHGENAMIDGFSLATFISATAGLTAIEPGKQLHGYALKSGLNRWISVSNGLIDMYSKCGNIEAAHKAFLSIEKPNVASWNGMISGLASNGDISNALSSFEDMRLANIQPDDITMLVVLYACSHGGLVDLGVDYFNSMREIHGLAPKLDHYVCLVDLLGRAGRLEEAVCAIETIGFKVEDPLVYMTLLNYCKIHKNLVMGECMARRAMDLDPLDPAVYVVLAGLYYDAGKMEMGDEVRKMMRERGLNKSTGQSHVKSRKLSVASR